jgi:hypothetical protein
LAINVSELYVTLPLAQVGDLYCKIIADIYIARSSMQNLPQKCESL